MKWTDFSTTVTAPPHGLLDDVVTQDFQAISQSLLNGIVYVPTETSTFNEESSALVPAIRNECETFANDDGPLKALESDTSDSGKESMKLHCRTLLSQAQTRVHSMESIQDMEQVKKVIELMEGFLSYQPSVCSPLKPANVNKRLDKDPDIDIPVPKRKGKQERNKRKWEHYKEYQHTHSATGRKKAIREDGGAYEKHYKTSKADRANETTV